MLTGWAIGWADGSNIIVIFCGVCKQQFSFFHFFSPKVLHWHSTFVLFSFFHGFIILWSNNDFSSSSFGLFLYFFSYFHTFFFLCSCFLKSILIIITQYLMHYSHSFGHFVQFFCHYSYMYKYFISYNVCCVWVQRPALTRSQKSALARCLTRSAKSLVFPPLHHGYYNCFAIVHHHCFILVF